VSDGGGAAQRRLERVPRPAQDGRSKEMGPRDFATR
jgi:hypothetical protein